MDIKLISRQIILATEHTPRAEYVTRVSLPRKNLNSGRRHFTQGTPIGRDIETCFVNSFLLSIYPKTRNGYLDGFSNAFPNSSRIASSYLFASRYVTIIIFLHCYRHSRVPDSMTGNRTRVRFNQAQGGASISFWLAIPTAVAIRNISE